MRKQLQIRKSRIIEQSCFFAGCLKVIWNLELHLQNRNLKRFMKQRGSFSSKDQKTNQKWATLTALPTQTLQRHSDISIVVDETALMEIPTMGLDNVGANTVASVKWFETVLMLKPPSLIFLSLRPAQLLTSSLY